MKTKRIPKTLQKVLDGNSHKIDQYYMEEDDFNGGWCIWVHLKEGFYSPDMEGSTIREHCRKEAINKINNVIQAS